MFGHLQLLFITVRALSGLRFLDFYHGMSTLLFEFLRFDRPHGVLIISLLFSIHIMMERLLVVMVIYYGWFLVGFNL